MIVDTLFLLASAAFGLGLSLATYRLFATRNGWPMGEIQADAPVVAVLVGLFAIVVAFLFAAARGTEFGGWAILMFGLFLAFLWTGFLRVASQISLFLAPALAVLLLLGWAHVTFPGSDREIVRNKTYFEPRDRSGNGSEFRDERGRIETLPSGSQPGLIIPKTIDPRPSPSRVQ